MEAHDLNTTRSHKFRVYAPKSTQIMLKLNTFKEQDLYYKAFLGQGVNEHFLGKLLYCC